MTHSSPNLAQVPASKTNKEGQLVYGFEGGYGADCRSLFTVPEDKLLLGCDASGLELRMLAHYLGSQEYIDILLNGDIHTFNQKAAGLPTRNDAKTFAYATLYGAGFSKLGSIVGGGSKEGKKLKASFMDNVPGLRKLIEGVTSASERGWIKSIDGGRIKVRSSHAALNYLLQSAGAIVMKVFLRQFVTRTKHLDVLLVGNVHDEIGAEINPKDQEEINIICETSMLEAGKELGFRLPIEGEALFGRSWDTTH